MSAYTEHSDSKSGGSFFVVAAWYSFLMPFLAPLIWLAIAAGTGGYLGVAFIWALCFLITSFISGVVSLFGFSRHGRKRILWMAVIGIVVSLILGCFSLGFWDMLQTWHG